MRRLFMIGLLMTLTVVSREALAQGKSGKAKAAPGQTKKVTPDAAVLATKEMLVKHGFTFVRVERVGVTHVVYYRRGNMGNGRGLGPVEKMVIKPSGDVVVFESAPSVVLIDVKLRLGL